MPTAFSYELLYVAIKNRLSLYHKVLTTSTCLGVLPFGIVVTLSNTEKLSIVTQDYLEKDPKLYCSYDREALLLFGLL